MIDTEKLYPASFFEKRARYTWRAPIVCGSIASWFELNGWPLESAVDLGCAIGDLVQGFLDLGIEAFGFDGSAAARPYIVCPTDRWDVLDLRKPLGSAFEEFHVDVCTCFEVAEHLEEEYADQFIENLCCLSDVIIMSACPPHPTKKATKYHPNEQPIEYWIEKFDAAGYAENESMYNFFRKAWAPWRKRYGIAAFWQNLVCFRRNK